jgi:hypothetical protein
MFENQVENYIGKVLVAEAKGDGQFLTENEIAFRVTGMMYKDNVKSDGPISLRSIKGKMSRVRSICDEKGMLMLPKVEKIEDLPVITGWKIASGADLDYIGEVFLGIKPAKTDTADAPEAEAETKK